MYTVKSARFVAVVVVHLFVFEFQDASDINRMVKDRRTQGFTDISTCGPYCTSAWSEVYGLDLVLSHRFQTREKLGRIPSAMPILNFQSGKCQGIDLDVGRYTNRETSQGTVSSIKPLPLQRNGLYLGLLFSSSALGSEYTVYTFQDFLS